MFPFMVPGMVCPKSVWFVADHTDMCFWVYHTDGSTIFVAMM
jgi:hypothetical protein